MPGCPCEEGSCDLATGSVKTNSRSLIALPCRCRADGGGGSLPLPTHLTGLRSASRPTRLGLVQASRRALRSKMRVRGGDPPTLPRDKGQTEGQHPRSESRTKTASPDDAGDVAPARSGRIPAAK